MLAIDKKLMGHLHTINNWLENHIKTSRIENGAIRHEVRSNFNDLNNKFTQLSIDLKENVDKRLKEVLEGVKKELLQGLV